MSYCTIEELKSKLDKIIEDANEIKEKISYLNSINKNFMCDKCVHAMHAGCWVKINQAHVFGVRDNLFILEAHYQMIAITCR